MGPLFGIIKAGWSVVQFGSQKLDRIVSVPHWNKRALLRYFLTFDIKNSKGSLHQKLKLCLEEFSIYTKKNLFA